MPKKKEQKNKNLPMRFPIEISKFSFDEHGEAPEEIQVLPIGRWNHPVYGILTITSEDVAEFKANFDKGLRKSIPITEGHESFDEKPAVGWFVELIDRGGNGLFAKIEWTKEGKTLLSEKSYKYFSPEFFSEYEDPQTREIHKNVLVGGALTNKPYFKELDAVVMSEEFIKNNKLNFNDMDLKELLAKKIEDLSTEEKSFIKEKKEDLTAEQKETFKTVIEDEKAELTEEEKKANVEAGKNEDGSEKTEEKPEGNGEGEGEGNGEGEGEGEGEGNGEGEGDGKKEASEFKTDGKGNVIMTMAEVKALSAKANAGFDASEKLVAAEIKTATDKLIFSEQNSKGKILPKNEKQVFSFMQGLNEVQRKTFAEIVSLIPSKELFNEKGSGQAVEGSAYTEAEAKAKTLMSDGKMKYAEAIRQVFRENDGLSKRYTAELKK